MENYAKVNRVPAKTYFFWGEIDGKKSSYMEYRLFLSP